jgi:hypothetical protein
VRSEVLEERDDMAAVYGLMAIGILVMEDLAAVLFLAASKGKLPSPWAIGLLALIPLRPYLQRLVARIGHGGRTVTGDFTGDTTVVARGPDGSSGISLTAGAKAH